MGGVAQKPSSSPLVSSWFRLLPPDLYHPAVSLPGLTEFLPDVRANMDDPPSWNPVLSYDLRKSATPYSTSMTSQHGEVSALPPLPSYVAGEFEAYVGNVEHGNSERETEQQPFGSWGPFPEPVFQAGELSQYESIFEHGNEERETEADGFMPHYSFPPQGFWRFPRVFPVTRPRHPSEPSMNDPFFPARIPGAFSHFQSKYERGGNYWDEAGFRRFR